MDFHLFKEKLWDDFLPIFSFGFGTGNHNVYWVCIVEAIAMFLFFYIYHKSEFKKQYRNWKDDMGVSTKNIVLSSQNHFHSYLFKNNFHYLLYYHLWNLYIIYYNKHCNVWWIILIIMNLSQEIECLIKRVSWINFWSSQKRKKILIHLGPCNSIVSINHIFYYLILVQLYVSN